MFLGNGKSRFFCVHPVHRGIAQVFWLRFNNPRIGKPQMKRVSALLTYIILFFNEATNQVSGYKVTSFGGGVPLKVNSSFKSGGAVPLSALQLGAAEIQAGQIIDAVDSCLGPRMVAAETDAWMTTRLNKAYGGNLCHCTKTN